MLLLTIQTLSELRGLVRRSSTVKKLFEYQETCQVYLRPAGGLRRLLYPPPEFRGLSSLRSPPRLSRGSPPRESRESRGGGPRRESLPPRLLCPPRISLEVLLAFVRPWVGWVRLEFCDDEAPAPVLLLSCLLWDDWFREVFLLSCLREFPPLSWCPPPLPPPLSFEFGLAEFPPLPPLSWCAPLPPLSFEFVLADECCSFFPSFPALGLSLGLDLSPPLFSGLVDLSSVLVSVPA
mmetsp:Transcript_11861/g.21790  ORF Transcript_11861/g.21790 Transcript_11861/m.21790 type:complete len:236 (-) Transcript_11861:4260-4967(-)